MNINRDASSSNSKIVYDITKFTHLDYPNHLACIIWFIGCNMRCDYCYNSDIVYAKSGNYTLGNAVDFLKSRRGMLEAVVLSGGEATSHELSDFCKEIKKLGFLIKLDTNGTNFKNLKTLCDSNLIDYVALDYKSPSYKFTEISKSNKFDQFSRTLEYLIKSGIDFEVRTTLHTDMLSEEDINEIIEDLKSRGYRGKYYIQEFLDTGKNLGGIGSSAKAFDRSILSDELEVIFR